MNKIENGKIVEMTPSEVAVFRAERIDKANRNTLGKAVHGVVTRDISPEEVVAALRSRNLPVA